MSMNWLDCKKMKKYIVDICISGAIMGILCGCAGAGGDSSFAAATFNLRYPVDEAPLDWESRAVRARNIIRANRFDIVGVQEPWKKQIDLMLRGTNYRYIGGGRDDFKDKGEHSAIVYDSERFEVLDSGTFGLSEQPETPGVCSWGSGCPRIATWGLFLDRRSGRRFLFYNTHLDHASDPARQNGVRLLATHAARQAPGTPRIVTGDFNATPDSPTYAIAVSLLRDAATVSETGHTGPMGTFHGYGKHVRTAPIDYIFVSDGIEVKSHRTVSSMIDGEYASDHDPVVAELRIQPETKR